VPSLTRPDGCRLYYEIHGPSAEGPLVLLEGMGGDIPGWRRNIPHLASEHRVVAFDSRGNGLSDKPDERMTMAIFVEDTVALLDELGIERAHVYGQSFGGMVAQELALTHPDRVRSLVLACTHAGPKHALKPGLESHVPKTRPYLALYSAEFAALHPEHIQEDLRVGRENPQPAYAGLRQWEAIQRWSSYDRLPEISNPTLILHGTEDRLIPAANAEMLAERIPVARLALLEGAGHNYHSERADEADAIVLEFLREVDRAS
jgi:pimeloyl-ACP methyl ester carboxylesterase